MKEVIKECTVLRKTQNLQYKDLEMQEYLKVLYPNQSQVILRSRCQTLNLKTHNSYRFEEGDVTCRKCGIEDETLEHVINCGVEELHDHIDINVGDICDIPSELLQSLLARMVLRIESFFDSVK